MFETITTIGILISGIFNPTELTANEITKAGALINKEKICLYIGVIKPKTTLQMALQLENCNIKDLPNKKINLVLKENKEIKNINIYALNFENKENPTLCLKINSFNTDNKIITDISPVNCQTNEKIKDINLNIINLRINENVKKEIIINIKGE